MKNKGMIVKIKNSYCIVLTKDGTYHKVPLSGRQLVRVGAEMEFSTFGWSRFIKPALMAASFLILVFGFSLYRNVATPEAFAYVSLDINPSVELAVDKDLKVLNVRPLNGDAEKLLASIQLRGSDLYTSVNSILAESVREGYIKPGQKNYVLSTVTVNNEAAAVKQSGGINNDSLSRNLETAVENKGLDIQIVILSSDRNTRDEAVRRGLSTGKFVVYKEAVSAGEKVTLKQVKENSLTQLVNVYRVQLLPNDKKLKVKSVHIPPHVLDNVPGSNDITSPDIDNAARRGEDEKQNGKLNDGKKKDADKQINDNGETQDRTKQDKDRDRQKEQERSDNQESQKEKGQVTKTIR
ncbi:MAG: hypothetical protein CVV03_08530 [Firmicutes bacterium HGW-Firmicutes-8]|nr:MAG: hypothetical protein CVV03_08530 [Firmicutes bacterium HGW-Firmicutes-8]